MITKLNLKSLLALVILFSTNILISADTKYKVRRGDTIESIAKKYNTTVQQIKDMNYSIDRIFVGMTLNLPDEEERTIKHEKKGFRWICLKKKNLWEDSYMAVLSINGDTIIPYSLGCRYISYKDAGEYGGTFHLSKNMRKKYSYNIIAVYDLTGEPIIPFDREFVGYIDQTVYKNQKLFFKVGINNNRGKKKKDNPSKFGILDVDGDFIINPIYKDLFITKNYILADNKQLEIPYKVNSGKNETIRSNNQSAINMSLVSYQNLPQNRIIHTENDGFFWTEISNGYYSGAEDSYGQIIFPISEGYNKIQYIPIPNRTGIFIVSKQFYNTLVYKGVYDIEGKVIIDLKNEYQIINYREFFPEIPGCLIAQKRDFSDYSLFDIYGQRIIGNYEYDFLTYDLNQGFCWKGIPINVTIDKDGRADTFNQLSLSYVERGIKRSHNKSLSRTSVIQNDIVSNNTTFPQTSTMVFTGPNILNTMPVFGTISTKNFKEEYEEFCRNHKKADGSDYSYEEYLAIRYPLNNTINDSNIFPDNSSNQVNKSKQLNYHSCGLCHGSGKCQACDGTGIFKDKTFGTGSQGKKCKVCNESGICPHCHGDKGYYRHY